MSMTSVGIRKRPLIAVLMLILGLGMTLESFSSDPNALRTQVRDYRLHHESAILKEFEDFLSIPNVATDRTNISRNAELLLSMMNRRGLKTQLLHGRNGSPVVFGELETPGAKRTVAFYAHYDGQPVVPGQWSSNPWKPILRDKPVEDGGRELNSPSSLSSLPTEARLYARSASDDKAPIVALLSALDALRASRIPIFVNLKFFFEGEEEAGSPNLRDVIQTYAELLKADVWILCDGPVHQTRRMQVYFGARGISDLEMTVYGAVRPLHSGHYGNWAPNPAILLADLLAKMRDTDAHIRIPGFYSDVRELSEAEKSAVARMPEVDTELRNSLGLNRTEGNGKRLEEQILLPALNIRGIQAGEVGAKASNAIPTEASASIDFRLVPDQTPDKVKSRVEVFIRQQGFYIVHKTPDISVRRAHAKIARLQWGDGYPPARTSMDLPVSVAVSSVIERTLGEPILKAPTLGGSVPMYLFLDVLKTPVIGLPIVNHDNNQHGANENLRIQNLWDGIEVFAGILAGLGRVWQ